MEQTEGKKTVFTKKRMLIGALALCVCVMVAALVYIGVYFTQYFGQKRLEDEISSLYQAIPPAPSPSIPAVFATDPSPSPDELSPSGGPSEPPPSEPLAPPVKSEFAMLIEAEKEGMARFAPLLEINEDFRGMMFIPNLLDDDGLAFVLGDDNAYYLDRDLKGEYNLNGTIFMHYQNSRLLTDRNTVLFGHNMNTGAMFAKLHNYHKAETFKTAPLVQLDSLTGQTTWIVFAAYDSEPDWGYIATKPTLNEFADLLDEIKGRSLFHTDVDVTENDRILTLSTCSYAGSYEDLRFVVHARQLRPGETAPTEVIATPNPDPIPFTPPDQIARKDMKAAATAVMQHPRSLKTYYYQIGDGKIEWYSGGSTLQGPYKRLDGKVKPGSLLSAAYHPGEEKVYYALDHYNGNQGIYFLTSKYPSSNIRFVPNSGAVTPAGEDAVSPSLSYTLDTMWLLYTVKKADTEEIYRAPVTNNKLGTPELVYTLPSNTGARVIGQVAYANEVMVFWHEKGSQIVRGTWIGSGEVFYPQFNGQNDRLTLYGEVSDGKIKVMAEKDGLLTPAVFDLTSLPAKPVPPPQTPKELPVEVSAEPATPVETPIDAEKPAPPAESPVTP
jgi:sortase B